MLALVSCAGPRQWQNPDVGRQQWSNDRAACEREARLEFEKEYARERLNREAGGLAATSSYEANMAQFESRRRIGELAGHCLKRRGYRKAPD
ncbi:MAG: hypothetical protein V3R66_00060 [Rhodospirillales bacterium]